MRKATIYFLSFAISLLMLQGVSGVSADQTSERRVKAGIKLFRAMLAADLDISDKKAPDGSLALLLFYTNDKERAEKLGKSLNKRGRTGAGPLIRNLPIKVETTSDVSFQRYKENSVAGIFITQSIGSRELEKIIQFGIDRRIVVYSPFEGPVEEGVLGGLSVEARVRPYVNIKTLRRSEIRIKPFFMKVAKRYE